MVTVTSGGAAKMEGPAKNGWGEHIDDELLERYALDRLEEPRTTTIEEHLLLCEYCRGRLEELDSYVVTLRDAIQQSVPPRGQNLEASRGSGGLTPAWAVTAAAAAVLGVAYLAPFRHAVSDPVPVQLRATRGEAPGGVALAGQPLELRLDITGLPGASSYRVEIVDTAGHVTFAATARSGPGGVVVKAPSVPAGTYWVRLSDPLTSDLVREYALKINHR